MSQREHPAALPHGDLQEVFPGIHLVTGTVQLGPGIRFSRNMTVVREDDRLVLINSVRLTEPGLRALEQLGRVTDVVRLAGFHGMDDPFYKTRYGARIWAMPGMTYRRGFDFSDKAPAPYFQADAELDPGGKLPLGGAKLHVFSSRPPEALLLLEREGGIVVSGDCLQNWATPDRYFSLLGGLMMRVMGFIKPHNVGPGWLKGAKPPAADLRAILDHRFEHVLPAHGAPVVGGAREKYRSAIDRAAALRSSGG